jgi:hypothetical protein
MALPEWIRATRQTIVIPSVPSPIAEMVTAAEARPENRLDFPSEVQMRRQWCWAAVTVGVARFYKRDIPLQQCTLAERVLNLSNCCVAGACDRQSPLRRPLCIVGHLEREQEGPLPFGSVVEAINRKRPVVCRMSMERGLGHAVVLFGYNRRTSQEFVYVADPEFHESDCYPLRKFGHRYRRRGIWTDTYTTS